MVVRMLPFRYQFIRKEKGVKHIIHWFTPFLRKEGDSNPRYPLGVYTLSRRASSTTRASFLVSPNVHNLYVGLKLVCKNRTLVLQ